MHICERVPVCACVCVVGEVTGGGISVFLCCFVSISSPTAWPLRQIQLKEPYHKAETEAPPVGCEPDSIRRIHEGRIQRKKHHYIVYDLLGSSSKHNMWI